MDEDILQGKTLLVVDDETDLRDIVASELEFMGAEVFQAENITVAQKILEQQTVDLVISDIRMPGGTGIDLLDKIKAREVNIPPVILITGFADITAEDAFDKGAEALVNKPFKLDDLIKLVLRYTAPFNERFKAEGSVERTIDLTGGNVNFGRGGVSLSVSAVGKKVEVGETFNFTLTTNEHDYSGRATCRWVRPSDRDNELLMGLEFITLSKDSITAFSQLFQGKKVVPFIPSLKTLD